MDTTPQIRFEDGAAYEGFMGRWSQIAGETFLRFLAPPAGLRWVDVGCGNGAFTELLVQHCAPASVDGIDPSPAQIAYAQQRAATAAARFQQGDAMALPYADASLDAAVMALVIFFVPDPARGVAEMARVLRPGGSASAYAWDILGGGFPFGVVQQAMAEFGVPPIWPPSVEASRPEALQALWRQAGFEDVQSTQYEVERSFDGFDAFWQIAQTGPRLFPALATMAPADHALLQQRVRERVEGADGRVLLRARVNAIKGVRGEAGAVQA